MKLIVEENKKYTETVIKITCNQREPQLNRLIEQINLFTFSTLVNKDGLWTPVALEEIFYFESVNNKTFVYLEKQVYPCEEKLYELEEKLIHTSFVRISKHCILNTLIVDSVKPQLSGRLEVRLDNQEKLIVSRHYLKEFRDKFIH